MTYTTPKKAVKSPSGATYSPGDMLQVVSRGGSGKNSYYLVKSKQGDEFRLEAKQAHKAGDYNKVRLAYLLEENPIYNGIEDARLLLSPDQPVHRNTVLNMANRDIFQIIPLHVADLDGKPLTATEIVELRNQVGKPGRKKK